MTSGPSQPGRCGTPFFLATLLAAMDAEVTVFLAMDGVQLARHGVAQDLRVADGGKPVIEFIRDAKLAGARLMVCRPPAPGWQPRAEELIEEVDEISSGGVLAQLIIECDKALSF